MQVIFQETNVEDVVKGRNRYSIAQVTYTVNGNNRTHKILSFANPEVFKIVKDLKSGTTIDVTVAKNEAGYDTWTSVKPVTATEAPKFQPAAKTATSQYETREERLERQLHIVRQSSLKEAVNTLTPGAKGALDPNKVIEVANIYVDWVYQNEFDQEDLGPADPIDEIIPV